jgi:hypothetical protein
MLLQVDASRHDRLEGRGPYLTLIGGIDDCHRSGPLGVFLGAGGRPGLVPALPGAGGVPPGHPMTVYSDQ